MRDGVSFFHMVIRPGGKTQHLPLTATVQSGFSKQMAGMFKILRFTILLAAMLPLSCATFLPPTNNLSKLDETNSVIFGTLEVLNHDKPMAKPFETFLDPDPILMIHVSPYVSDTALNKNLWKAGKYAFKVPVFKDGHFSCVIPPGKYYFVEFDFFDFFDAKPIIGFRTYTGHWWQNVTPYLMTFDVPADRAVYIGTIRFHFYTQWNNWFAFKGSLFIDSTNDFAEAREWFLKSDPQFGTNIIESVVETRELSR